jgi:hypothetical protein
MSIGGSQCGDAEVMRLRLQSAHAEIERLHSAIRRLAEQDATLSVQGGNVTVTMDATLTTAERGSLDRAASWLAKAAESRKELHSAGYICEDAAVLRSILERFN